MYIESKFVAFKAQKGLIEEFLQTHLKNSDPFSMDHVYNLYFDTPELRSTHQASFLQRFCQQLEQ